MRYTSTAVGMMRALAAATVFMPIAAMSATGLKEVPDILSAHGTCKLLVTGGTDHSAACSGNLLNTSWKNGRIGFYFSTTDNAVVTFTGMSGQQIKKDADTVLQPIDGVIFNFNGKGGPMKAIGSCKYTNPYNGAGTISCNADTAQGVFQAEFLTDGSAPKRMSR